MTYRHQYSRYLFGVSSVDLWDMFGNEYLCLFLGPVSFWDFAKEPGTNYYPKEDR
jgi:hypothetical protein